MECEDDNHLWESLIIRSIALPIPDSDKNHKKTPQKSRGRNSSQNEAAYSGKCSPLPWECF